MDLQQTISANILLPIKYAFNTFPPQKNTQKCCSSKAIQFSTSALATFILYFILYGKFVALPTTFKCIESATTTTDTMVVTLSCLNP